MSSVLDVRFLLADLNTYGLLVCDEDFLLSVKLELVVNGPCVENFDLVLVQNASLDLPEVPGD